MGAKAEGAAQGFTLLGAIVLVLIALFQLLIPGVQGILNGNANALLDTVLGIALLLMAILGLDACGFVYWKIRRSGLLLAIFGLVAIFIVARNVNFDIIGWLMNAGTLAGLMLLIAGILLIAKS